MGAINLKAAKTEQACRNLIYPFSTISAAKSTATPTPGE
jgi:hypothetical protein